MLRALAFLCFLLCTAPVFAGTVEQPKPPPVTETGGDHARLVVDDKAGAVIILIDNKETVRIDKDGLHVVEGKLSAPLYHADKAR